MDTEGNKFEMKGFTKSPKTGKGPFGVVFDPFGVPYSKDSLKDSLRNPIFYNPEPDLIIQTLHINK